MADDTQDAWLVKFYEDQARRREANKALMVMALATLQARGYTALVAGFDGSGDSGQIETIRGYTAAEHSAALTDAQDGSPWNVTGDTEIGGVSLDESNPKSLTLDEFLYELLASQDFDWVNNVGGFGTIVLDTLTGQARVYYNQRIEDTQFSTYTL